MRIRGIDFPEGLIDAQRDGNLVVFAGAGVSMGQPANYPSSRVLAEMVGGAAYQIGNTEREDQFLGRLEQADVPVRQRMKQFLSNPESRPTPLHHLLIDLFRDKSQIRLVTTNLDTHFTTAARISGAQPDFYYAPALPLGHRFTGIVYLHGCVGRNENEFVLTDADFGRAYLTEGWATRFLQALFQQYTVLFIGYSHDDTVINYLARGLPPHARPRFVLTSQTHKDHWSLIKMGVLSYSSANNHIALTEGVRGWVELSRMGALDHERRVETIVSSPPPPDGEEADYIAQVIDDPGAVHFFTSYAHSVQWMRWAEEHGVFRYLFRETQFDAAAEIGNVAQHLARWFASNFVIKHVDEAIALVRRLGRPLSFPLWDEIAATLATDSSRPAGVLARWAAILFPPPSFANQSNLLEDLVRSCRAQEDNPVALFLFDYLTNVRLRLREASAPELPEWEVELMGFPFGLKLAWRQVFQPRMDEFAVQLEPIITNRLRQAHLLLSTMVRPDECASPETAAGVNTEDDGVDLGAGVEFLTGAAQDLIGWLWRHEPETARRLKSDWLASEVPTLEHIASRGDR